MKYLILLLLFSCSAIKVGEKSRTLANKDVVTGPIDGQKSIRDNPGYKTTLESLAKDLKHLISKVNNEKWVALSSSIRSRDPLQRTVDFNTEIEQPNLSGQEILEKYISFLKEYSTLDQRNLYALPAFFIDPFRELYDGDIENRTTVLLHKMKKGSAFINSDTNSFMTEKTMFYYNLLLNSECTPSQGSSIRSLIECNDDSKLLVLDALKQLKVDYMGRSLSLENSFFRESSGDVDTFYVIDSSLFNKGNIFLISRNKKLQGLNKKESKDFFHVAKSVFLEKSYMVSQFKDSLLYKSLSDSLPHTQDTQKVGRLISKHFFTSNKLLLEKKRDWNKYPDERISIDERSKISPFYKQAYESLKKDLLHHVRETPSERWVFNYNDRVNKQQYKEETLKNDGGLSIDNQSFIETGRFQARSFFKSYSSGGNCGNGLYFFIDPLQLARGYTDTIPIGTVLKIPQGTRYYEGNKAYFLSDSTYELFRKIDQNSSLSSHYSVVSLLTSSKIISHLIYDAIKELKIDLFTYKYSDSDFLNIDGGKFNTAFVLINEELLNKKNVLIIDRHSYEKYSGNEMVKTLKKIANSGVSSSFHQLFFGGDYPDKDNQTSDKELIEIKNKYFFKKEELKPIKALNL